MFDGVVAAAVGCGVGAAVGAAMGGGAPDVALAAGQGAALLLWVLRDALGDGGNRSWGKRLFRLELACADGTLAPPRAAALRSAYLLLLPLAGMHPFVNLTLETLLFADLATLVLTPDARKVGDYALGCRCVEERPGRAQRARDLREAEEVAELRRQIEQMAPGLLAAREKEAPQKKWYSIEHKILAGAAAGEAPLRRPSQQLQQEGRLPPLPPSGAAIFGEILGQGEGAAKREAGDSELGAGTGRSATSAPAAGTLLDRRPPRK
jgi:hypothetical protein